jgi:hypothetical protein
MNAQGRSRFSQTEEQMEGMTGQATEYLSRGYEQAEHMVTENPMASMLTFFGIGVGLGVMLSSLMSEEEERSSSWSRWGRQMSHRFDESSVERIGSQIMDSIMHMLPERLSSRLSS